MRKKIVCLTLLAALILAPAPAVLAEDAQTLPVVTPEGALIQPAPLPAPYYLEFSGKVTEINPYYNLDGSESGKLFVLTESGDGMLMNFVVDDKTVLPTGNELKTGADVIGFYLGNAPAIMIYPPQMHAEILAVDLPPLQMVKAAIFDENLLSDDGQLKLNLGPDTQIERQDGSFTTFSDPVSGISTRPIVVFYSITTRSLPPQTTPGRIILLDKEEEQTAPQPEDMAVDGMPLVVANVLQKDAPPIYVHESGAVMIPLRVVAEALGYEVGWQSGTVTLNGRAVVVIGQDDFAELRAGVTYVPLNFFRETLGLNNAYVLEKQVFIDNDERMD